MKKVLLIDDVRLFIEMEKGILNRSGALQIFTASSGIEGLKVLKSERMDLVLCDLYMPEMNGDELCRMVRKDPELSSIPFIMVTTSNSQEDIDRCREAGASDFFPKPVNPTELLRKVSSFVEIPLRESLRIPVNIGVIDASSGRISEETIGTALDLSVGGFLLETPQKFETGQSKVFSLVIPGDGKEITSTGTVIRNASGKRTDMNYYGIKFTEIKDGDRKSIEDYVKGCQ